MAYQPNRVRIADEHYDLLASHGDRTAVIATINHDAESIVGVMTFYDAGFTVAVESCYPNATLDRYDRYHEMLNFHGDTPDVIAEFMRELVRDQEQSDDPTMFSWELVVGTESVVESEELQDVLATVVEPDRLAVPFEVPDDGTVVEIECSYEQHEIISEANDRYGYAAVDIHRFRGATYIVGLTSERQRTIADGCHKLQREYSEMSLHDSARSAERAESLVHRADEVMISEDGAVEGESSVA